MACRLGLCGALILGIRPAGRETGALVLLFWGNGDYPGLGLGQGLRLVCAYGVGSLDRSISFPRTGRCAGEEEQGGERQLVRAVVGWTTRRGEAMQGAWVGPRVQWWSSGSDEGGG